MSVSLSESLTCANITALLITTLSIHISETCNTKNDAKQKSWNPLAALNSLLLTSGGRTLKQHVMSQIFSGVANPLNLALALNHCAMTNIVSFGGFRSVEIV